MAERAGKDTVIKISGAAVAMVSQATTTADDQAYQISDASKQVLDRDTPPTVLDNGVETVEDYSVDYLYGTIIFSSVDVGRGPITITGKYLPMTTAAYANKASKSEGCDVLDVTVFGDTHRKRKAGLRYRSGSLSQFNVADETYVDALIAGVPVVLEHRSKSTDDPSRTWGLLNSSEVVAAVEGVQEETVSWISHDAWIKLEA